MEKKAGQKIFLRFFHPQKRNGTRDSDSPGHQETDVLNVMNAASLLQISEFQLFHLAYSQWYGRETSDRTMERIFINYMFDNIVPHWVRQLTRKILNIKKQNNLDPLDFNIIRRTITPDMRARGQWYAVLLFIILIIFCVLISGYTPPQ